MTEPGRVNVYEIVSSRILEALDKGVIPWQKPWTSMGGPKNFKSKKAYRGINVWLLGLQGRSSPWWLTLKQANELGGRIRSGEKASICVFWKVGKYMKKDTVTGEDEEQTSFLLRYYNVFNEEQISGIEFPKPESRAVNTIDGAVKIWEGYPGKPALKHGGDRACYRVTSDEIDMPVQGAFNNDEAYYATLFHEAAHSTGHATRLKRFDEQGNGREKYATEELVAEMGAAFLANMCGIDRKEVVDCSAGYIQHWRDAIKADNRLVVSAGSKAQKAVDHILGVTFEKAAE